MGKQRGRRSHEPPDRDAGGRRHGPGASVAATAAALDLAEDAAAIVLVEGVSDVIALETLSVRLGHDLVAHGVVIVPTNGAQAIGRFLERFGPHGDGRQLAGLCDAAEEGWYRRGLAAAGVGAPRHRRDAEALGFFVCDPDLEAELIRASGRDVIERTLDEQGDLGAFRTLQRQPPWRDRSFDEQMHRWLRAGARRSLRYAGLLAERADPPPRPLRGVLDAACSDRR